MLQKDFFFFSTFPVDKHVENPWKDELSLVAPEQIVSRWFFELDVCAIKSTTNDFTDTKPSQG